MVSGIMTPTPLLIDRNTGPAAGERWCAGGMDLLLENGDPVDAGEPAMFADIVDAALEVAVALAEVRL